VQLKKNQGAVYQFPAQPKRAGIDSVDEETVFGNYNKEMSVDCHSLVQV